MNVVGRVGSLITQGVYSVATPFHPFGGAVDIIIVEQQDGTYRSTPWYVRFGKFQGVLKGAEKVVHISVNGIKAAFHMYLDNSGEAYFVREIASDEDAKIDQGISNSDVLESAEVDNDETDDVQQSENDVSKAEDTEFSNSSIENGGFDNQQELLEFCQEQASQMSPAAPAGSPEYGSYNYGGVEHVEDLVNSQGPDSEVVLVSRDGLVLTAPFSSFEESTDDVQLSTPQFHLGPAEETEVTIEQLQDSANLSGSNGVLEASEDAWAAGLFDDMDASKPIGMSDGILSISGDNSTSICPSSDCNDSTTLAKEIKEVPRTENMGHTSFMYSSTEVVGANLARKETFKSCMELLDPSINDETLEGIVSSSVRLVENMIDSTLQSKEIQTGEYQNLENVSGLTPAVAHSMCDKVSCTIPLQIEDSESNIVVNERMNCAGSDSISAPSVIHGMYEDVVAVPEPQRSQNNQGTSPFEEECCRCEDAESRSVIPATERSDLSIAFEISLCRNLLHAGMGLDSAKEVFNSHRLSEEEFNTAGVSIIKNENLVVRYKEQYLTWDKAAPIVLAKAAFGLDFPCLLKDTIPVEQTGTSKIGEGGPQLSSTASGRSWRLWPIPFRRTRTLQHTDSNASSDDVFVDSESYLSPISESPKLDNQPPRKQFVRTNIPTSEQIASLNLKDGQNNVEFTFSTRVLGTQKVDAHIYLWKWNARIVISDVDGTITKSDVLGQFMPLVGKDWTQSGVAQLFSAIKENGYQLLFLSARAIVQAYLTRSFLLNLKQDGKALPSGPVVISPDGLFPSLYREVIRRAPHEFKIACLQDIRALFPADHNPFYAGFGNRDTDELSYRKIGIPKGKIFIINPKGEVAVNHSIDVKSYTSLHTLVHDMFPTTSSAVPEDFNSWNYWKASFHSLSAASGSAESMQLEMLLIGVGHVRRTTYYLDGPSNHTWLKIETDDDPHGILMGLPLIHGLKSAFKTFLIGCMGARLEF
ncbi:hypothetical protein ACLOJK_001640 [Asimina triloba]